MKSIKNSWSGIGNLGKDPETKHLDSGSQVSNFSIAISDKYKNKKGETVEETEWVNIVCWGKTSEIVEEYVKKGDKVAVEGKLKTRSWDDKDGNKRYTTEVVANEILMLGGKSESSNSTPSNLAPSDEDLDNLPF